MIRLLLAAWNDDEREGLAELLTASRADCWVTEARDGAELLHLARCRSDWSAILVDLEVAGPRQGLGLVRQLAGVRRGTPILVIGGEAAAVVWQRAGAAGCLDVACVFQELLPAVEQLLRGERYVSASLAEWLPAPA
jgi:DNA-binding NarL/FixJ family response regulator